jgi:hypothetical protein
MNDKYSKFSTDTTLQNDGPFHVALVWFAALLALIAAWAFLSYAAWVFLS